MIPDTGNPFATLSIGWITNTEYKNLNYKILNWKIVKKWYLSQI